MYKSLHHHFEDLDALEMCLEQIEDLILRVTEIVVLARIPIQEILLTMAVELAEVKMC